MAELGVVSAIVGLACLGAKLSKKLYQVGTKAVNANHNINRIATGVALYSSTLKHVAQVLSAAGSLHSPEALEIAQSIVTESERVYEEIGKMVLNIGNKQGDEAMPRRGSISQKVRWHFEQPKVEFLIAQLEYLKTTLSILIQTLNLAAVIAQSSRDQPNEERVEEIVNERIHVETLFIAQRLSIVVLNKYEQQCQDNDANEHSASDSQEGSEYTLEDKPGKPKLLTQEPHRSSSLIHLPVKNNPSFLDRTTPFNPEPFSPVTQAPNVVDQLLYKWTLLPEPSATASEEPEVRTVVTEPTKIPEAAPTKENVFFEQASAPTIALQVSTPAPASALTSTSRDVLPPPPPGPPPKKMLTPELTLQKVDSVPQAQETALVPSDYSYNTTYPPGRYLDIRGPPNPLVTNPSVPQLYTLNPGTSAGPLSLARTMSAPGSDIVPLVQPGLPPLQTSLQYPPPQYTQSRAVPISPTNYTTSPPGYSPNPGSRPSPSPHASPYFTHAYTSPQVPHQGIPRQSMPQERDYHDEEPGGGLNIPWRIRIGQRYWDFLDGKLVGPRTPYLPTEPMSWVYSHDNALTEVSSSWVCPQAIEECRFPYDEIHHEDYDPAISRSYDTRHDQHRITHYCIMQPLKFNDVEKLVNRTIQIYKQNAERQRSRYEPPRPYLRNAGPTPGLAPSPARRVSFTESSQRHLRTDSGWDRGIDRSPRTSGDFDERPMYAGGPHGQYWRQEEDWDERPPSRSKAGTSSKEKEKERKRSSKEVPSKKHRVRSTAAGAAFNIAKVGGLVAMLDGLDGLIL